eukprot:4235725-Prymnesium_polylepis.1
MGGRMVSRMGGRMGGRMVGQMVGQMAGHIAMGSHGHGHGASGVMCGHVWASHGGSHCDWVTWTWTWEYNRVGM